MMIQLGITQRPPIERRQATGDYSDLVVSAIQASARGYVNATGTAAVESAAGALSRSFASAAVTGPAWARQAIGPKFLGEVGRCLMRQGESLHLIEVSDLGEVSLVPASSWSFAGGPSPSSWMVEATLPGPSRSITRRVPFNSVIHQVWGSSPGLPYAGRSALQFAAVSAQLQFQVEKSMADEASGPVAQILPIPADGGDGGDDDPQADLKADIASAQGKAVLLETTSARLVRGTLVLHQSRDWIAVSARASPNTDFGYNHGNWIFSNAERYGSAAAHVLRW